MTKTIIEAEDLKKDFAIDGTSVPVLRGVSFEAEEGEMVSVIGPSGSGKTTLLNLLSGLDRPSGGRIVVDGVEITTLGETQLARLRRDKFGFIFQQYNLIPVLTAQENVELPCLVVRMGVWERRRRAQTLLERVGLGHRINHRPTQLSGGEQQRVSIARALMNMPKIVFADELTGNVDGQTGHAILELIKELNREQGVTFVIATHDMRVAEVTDRTLRMLDGLLIDHQTEGQPSANS